MKSCGSRGNTMRTDSNIIKTLAKLTNSNYGLFSEYCDLLNKGLRKEALKHLNSFIELTNNWDYKGRTTFCNFLFSLSQTDNDLDIVLSRNLNEKLIKPTLIEMTLSEPNNYLPFKWYGEYFNNTLFLKKAYNLKPEDKSIRILLLNRLENDLSLSTHHLPDTYLGDYLEDISNINLAFSILSSIEDKSLVEGNLKRFTTIKNEIEDYNRTNKNTNTYR